MKKVVRASCKVTLLFELISNPTVVFLSAFINQRSSLSSELYSYDSIPLITGCSVLVSYPQTTLYAFSMLPLVMYYISIKTWTLSFCIFFVSRLTFSIHKWFWLVLIIEKGRRIHYLIACNPNVPTICECLNCSVEQLLLKYTKIKLLG